MKNGRTSSFLSNFPHYRGWLEKRIKICARQVSANRFSAI